MAPHRPPIPKPADAKLGRTFDPWNSVAAGHQRAETRGPQGWRESRTAKLQSQLTAGSSGGERLSDTAGAGSEDFDEARRVLVPKDEARARAGTNVLDMLRRPGTMGGQQHAPGKEDGTAAAAAAAATAGLSAEERLMAQRELEDENGAASKAEGSGIFDGLVIYVNGSTHPLVSDHKLKHVLAENGARMSIHLGRRQVTHVILGQPSGPRGGAGGGLAGGKLEKEIRRVGGCGVKYVGVEWVLESLKAGRRLPEARFSNLKVASKGQPSVYGAFSKAQR